MNLILPSGDDAHAHLDALTRVRLSPFDRRALAFIADFSDRVLKDTSLRQHPELIALAWWFRPAAIKRLQQRHARLSGDGVLRPRGVVLHFAPANVDTVFVYSWFLSLLCGNRNIVRLSARERPAQLPLLPILAELLAAPRHAEIAAGTALLSYAHNDTTTAELSARCHLRVVWGGDAAVAHLRRVPLPPLATELLFPNRHSWAMFDAQAVADATEASLKALAKAFCNDAFWFGQQACSSPRSLLWLGDDAAIDVAQARFWPQVREELNLRGLTNSPTEMMQRINAAHLMAAQSPGLRAGSALTDWPLRLAAETMAAPMRDEHCGNGLFVELRRPELAASAELFAAKDQTLAYWGIRREVLVEWLADLPDRALDRVVPVGHALDFCERWDGHDLLLAFSRLVAFS